MPDLPVEEAERKVVKKYHKLYGSLTDLVDALQKMEPGGTLVDDIAFTQKKNGKVSIAYIATPIQVTISTKERRFILRVIEHSRSNNG